MSEPSPTTEKQETSVNLLQARLFAVNITGKKLANLSYEEKVGYELIKDNPDSYDITFNIDKDGVILAEIGGFTRDLTPNKYILWIPFLLIGVISNNAYMYLNPDHSNIKFVFIVNFLIAAIGIIGLPSVGYKPYFEKKSFSMWYWGLIASTVAIAFLLNL